MSNLPEWLWPTEDEEAIQEAERLIADTHNVLRRMEADLLTQRQVGCHFFEKTERLKSSVHNKMEMLEKELKEMSKSGKSVESLNHGLAMPKSNDIKGSFKIKGDSFGQQKTAPPEFKRRSTKNNSKVTDAEKVVQTARAKVQDALTVARNVSASLKQHVSSSSLNNKPTSRHSARNVGVFEVKSQLDEHIGKSHKPRLEQAVLPTISIKHALECQTIPSIQVLPGEKSKPINISVCNIQYEEGCVSEPRTTGAATPERKPPQQQPKTTSSPFFSSGYEDAIAQLSKQLAEVEELREVNQTQVNHVLRFLLSRVCNPIQPCKREDNQSTTLGREAACSSKQSSPVSHSTSSSESSKYSIAYDSLSRFLETYKKAAEQSMLVKKRASIRRQKVALQQKKDIQSKQAASKNHLLLGPLRQTESFIEKNHVGLKSDMKDEVSQGSSGSCERQINVPKVLKQSSCSLSESENKTEGKNHKGFTTLNESLSSSILDCSELLASNTFVGIGAEDYEDDWEEEENPAGPDMEQNQESISEEKSNPVDPLLHPIVESEEPIPIPSVCNAENRSQLQGSDSIKAKMKASSFSPAKPPVFEKKLEEEKGGSNALLINLSLNETRGPEAKFSGEQLEVVALHNSGETDLADATHSQSGGEDSRKLRNKSYSGASHKQSGGEQSVNFKNRSDCGPAHKESEGEESEKDRNQSNNVLQKTSSLLQDVKQRRQLASHRKRVRNLSPSSSSSEVDINIDSRHPLLKPRRWDLSLREDLQLQSAILLSSQFQNKLIHENRNGLVSGGSSNTSAFPINALAEVEKRWQQTLDQLDQRVKSIEDSERKHDFKQQENCCKSINPSNITVKVLTKEQMVQTNTPDQEREPLKPIEPFRNVNNLTLRQQFKPYPYQKQMNGQMRHQVYQPQIHSEDLTTELLAYSRMGVLPKLRFPEQTHSKSLSSSTTSSNFQQSSTVVSLSDGEMRHSSSNSCSCSEGELCACGRKRSSKRAPPDGSQTFSDGENLLKDISLGEIVPKGETHLLMDTSHVTTDISASGHNFSEESFESDWEPKDDSLVQCLNTT